MLRGGPTSYVLETVIEIACTEFPARISFDHEPGTTGRIYGPPESCYPPEPELLNLTELHVYKAGEWVDVSDVIPVVTDELTDVVEREFD